MKLLEEKIVKDGIILPGGVLKLDGLLGQKIDAPFAAKLAEEWKRIFEGEQITKILTIEASGIGLAAIAGLLFDVPVVYARKSKNDPDFSYSKKVVSYTHGTGYNVTVPKSLITDADSILIVDDFLANGSALDALFKICKEANAKIIGAGIAIEKSFAGGAEALRKRGYRIESLAKIKAVSDGGEIEFC